VTRNGGGTAFEALDGQSVYYMIHGKDPFSGSLWGMPVVGGAARQLVPSVVRRAFSPVKDGIYFVPEPGTDGKSYIQFLSFATGKVNTVAPLSARPSEGLSVSPDGRSLLYTQVDEAGSDLMLVENFH
jgi:hypothetical protein